MRREAENRRDPEPSSFRSSGADVRDKIARSMKVGDNRMFDEARRQILEQCLRGDYYPNPSHATTRWATKKGSEEPWAWDALTGRVSGVSLAVVDLSRRGIRKHSSASPNSRESGDTFVLSAELKRI